MVPSCTEKMSRFCFRFRRTSCTASIKEVPQTIASEAKNVEVRLFSLFLASWLRHTGKRLLSRQRFMVKKK